MLLDSSAVAIMVTFAIMIITPILAQKATFERLLSAEWSRDSRPHYDKPQPEYIPDSEVDVRHYAAFMDRQITELLTQYGPVAGIWLDAFVPAH